MMNRSEIEKRALELAAQRNRRLSEKQKQYAESVPTRHKAKVEKSLLGELTPGQSIKLKCIECCGFEDVENRIKSCTAWKCPLINFRPYK